MRYLQGLPDTKYMVSDIKRTDIILQRIKDNSALGYNPEEQQKAETITEIPQGSSKAP